MTPLPRRTATWGTAEAPFSVAASIRRARELLSEPPPETWVRRPEPIGDLVQEFALPLELCPTTNTTHHSHWRHTHKLKDRLYRMMWPQAGGYRREPLPGRPQVICVRFSNRLTDPFSDWAKHAVDILCVRSLKCPKRRLGFLRDDSVKHIDLHQWHEPIGKGEGFCYLQVRSVEDAVREVGR